MNKSGTQTKLAPINANMLEISANHLAKKQSVEMTKKANPGRNSATQSGCEL